jgi:hypothetical protein
MSKEKKKKPGMRWPRTVCEADFQAEKKLRVNIDAYESLCTLWNPADE